VERERWQGSPISRHGDLRPEYADFYVKLNAFLKHYRFWRFKRDCHALVLRNYDLARFAATTETLGYAHADLLGLPRELFRVDLDLDLRCDVLAEVDESRCDTWLGTLFATMAEQSLDYDIADTHIDMARLVAYRVVFMSAGDFMDLGDQQRILDAISAGATVVVGPGLPYTDPTMQRPGILDRYLDAPGEAQIGRGRLVWADQASLPDLIRALVPSPEFRCPDPAVALTVWRDGEQTLLFTANFAAQPCYTTIIFEGQTTLRCVWGQEETITGTQSVALHLQPYSVRIWEVTNQSASSSSQPLHSAIHNTESAHD
jgi:beta-galactosidase